MNLPRIARLTAGPALLLSSGCIGFSVGTEGNEFIRYRGVGTAYAAVPGIDDYDGKILKVGLFSRSPGSGGEIAGVELWPLFKVGVGLAGARVRVLPFELGAGLLFYHPRPQRRDLDDDGPEPRRRARKVEVIDADELAPPAGTAPEAAEPDLDQQKAKTERELDRELDPDRRR